VLWSGEHQFPGTAETIDMLRSKGMDYETLANAMRASCSRDMARQAAGFCDEQQHQVSRGLQEEV
jgi:ribonucleotide monophosphatase NagD (HAD superfamily)